MDKKNKGAHVQKFKVPLGKLPSSKISTNFPQFNDLFSQLVEIEKQVKKDLETGAYANSPKSGVIYFVDTFWLATKNTIDAYDLACSNTYVSERDRKQVYAALKFAQNILVVLNTIKNKKTLQEAMNREWIVASETGLILSEREVIHKMVEIAVRAAKRFEVDPLGTTIGLVELKRE